MSGVLGQSKGLEGNPLTEYIDRETFLNAPGRHKYFRDRWGFTSMVIERMRAMEPIGKVLELGPGPTGMPIIKGSTTMDHMPKFNPTVLYDARVVPWPFGAKEFDLFVALQAFEHLNGRQRAAFDEVRRVANRAIITLPFRCKSEFHRIGWPDYEKFFGVHWDEAVLVDSGKCPKYMLTFHFDGGNK